MVNHSILRLYSFFFNLNVLYKDFCQLGRLQYGYTCYMVACKLLICNMRATRRNRIKLTAKKEGYGTVVYKKL